MHEIQKQQNCVNVDNNVYIDHVQVEISFADKRPHSTTIFLEMSSSSVNAFNLDKKKIQLLSDHANELTGCSPSTGRWVGGRGGALSEVLEQLLAPYTYPDQNVIFETLFET